MKLIATAGRVLSGAITFLHVYANWVSAFVVLILMFLISVDILTRYVAHAPIPGSFEIGEFLMVFIVFLSLAQTQAENAHIKVEVLTSKLPAKARNAMALVPSLAGTFFSGLIVWENWGWALESLKLREYSAGIVNVPLYPAKIALVVGCGIFLLRFVMELVQNIVELRKPTSEVLDVT